MEIERIAPPDLAQPRGYAHAVAVRGARRTVYIGGQNAIDAHGALVGPQDLRAQTEQVLTNIVRIVAAAAGRPEHVVLLDIRLVHGQDPRPGFAAFQRVWGATPPPAITVSFVQGLGRPDWLVEIAAIAEVPEPAAG